MACGRNVTSLSIQQKLEILDLIKQDNISKKELSLKYKCDQSTISRIVHQEDKLRRSVHDNWDVTRKRLRKGKFEQIDEALANWFYKMRLKNATISGAMLMEEARKLAIDMHLPDFKASTGWLSRWKARYNVACKRPQEGKKASDEDSLCKPIEDELPNLIRGYYEKDIFIGNETGLLYKALPDRDDMPSSDRSEENRITLFLLCNMDGSERDVIAIGKQRNPYGFRGKNPFQYFSQENSWMTTEIWNNILVSFNDRMKVQNRTVVFFVVHTACHKLDSGASFSNLNIHFIPPNTTPLLGTLDQGFIRSFKANYRNIILKKHLLFLETGCNSQKFVDSLTLLDALRIVKRSWELVDPVDIKKSFIRTGFIGHNSFSDEIEIEQMLVDAPMLPSDFENFVDCDANLECYGELTDEYITSEVNSNSQPITRSEQDSDERDSKEAIKLLGEVPTRHEALTALSTLRTYLDFYGEDLNHIEDIEEQLFSLSDRKPFQTETNTCNIKIEPLN